MSNDDGHVRGFAAIPNHIIRDRTLPASARLLYGIIVSYGFNGRACTVSRERLSDEAGIGRSAFWDAVKILRARGLIEVFEIRSPTGRFNAYRATQTALYVAREDRPESGLGGRPESGPPRGGSSAQPDGGSSAQPDTEEEERQEEHLRGGAMSASRAQAATTDVPRDETEVYL